MDQLVKFAKVELRPELRYLLAKSFSKLPIDKCKQQQQQQQYETGPASSTIHHIFRPSELHAHKLFFATSRETDIP